MKKESLILCIGCNENSGIFLFQPDRFRISLFAQLFRYAAFGFARFTASHGPYMVHVTENIGSFGAFFAYAIEGVR